MIAKIVKRECAVVGVSIKWYMYILYTRGHALNIRFKYHMRMEENELSIFILFEKKNLAINSNKNLGLEAS